MASFSFGVGNARKLLRVPMYVGGRLATLLIPRSRDRWVFGCAWGVGDGAWALWEHARGEGVRAVWLTGSARDDLQAQARGIPWTRKGSLRGFWVTARAGVIVITHGFGDVNRYAATGGVIVQLWHGIPLKRLGLDAPVTMQVTARRLPARVQRILTRVVTAAYRRTQSRIRVLPAASQLVRGRLESAFGLPSTRVPVTGEPRTDVLFAGDADGRRARARTAVAEATGALGTARLILYAPTWRDGAPDPAVPTPAEADRLRALLTESDAVLLIRSHPHGAGAYARHAGERIRLLGADLVAEVTPLLPAIDVLITDYSSIVFDAALVPVPAVFLAPDLAAYARTRGFYGTFRDVSGEAPATTWDEAIAQTRAVLTDPAEHARRVAAARALSARVHDVTDGGGSARVFGAIQAALAAERRS